MTASASLDWLTTAERILDLIWSLKPDGEAVARAIDAGITTRDVADRAELDQRLQGVALIRQLVEAAAGRELGLAASRVQDRLFAALAVHDEARAGALRDALSDLTKPHGGGAEA